MEHPQGLLAKATNCLACPRALECKAQFSVWTLGLRTWDVLLGLRVWELGVAQAHQAEGCVAVAAGKLVRQAKGVLVGPLGEVPVGLRGVGLLTAQNGHQLREGGVWELVKKTLKAGVSPDLPPQMAIHLLEKGHQLLNDQLLGFTCSIRQRSPFRPVASGLGG